MIGKKIRLTVIAVLTAAMLAGGVFTGCKSDNTPSGGGQETGITQFDNSSSPYAEKIGVTNWGALYLPGIGIESALLYGARQVLETGSKVLKVACGDLSAQYPLDDWSNKTFEKSVDVFKDETFQELFSMGFKTFFISVPERKSIKFADGVSEEERAYVEEEFYLMTKYLLETYRGSGKTFILQNWETDNYVSYSLNGKDDELILRNYADYYNARQDGINRARDEFVMSKEKNVYVFGAIEINKLDESYNKPKAVDYIVPYTYCDLYTYSSYEYKDKGVVTSAEDVAEKLSFALGYYESKLPSEKSYPQPVYFGDKRLAITEFGYPDKADGYSGEWQKMVVEGHLLAMQELGLQYAVYWQLCCNEATGSNASYIKSLKGDKLRNYTFVPGDVNGFYLIRPDGTKTYTYNYLKEVIVSDKLTVTAECPPAWKI